jgi:hypothetical protein
MPFDPFNPGNNYQGDPRVYQGPPTINPYQGNSNSLNPFAISMSNMNPFGSSFPQPTIPPVYQPYLNPALAATIAGGRQMEVPSAGFFTQPSMGVFRGPTPAAMPMSMATMNPPSMLQSAAQASGLIPSPFGVMPIQSQIAASRNLETSAVSGAINYGTTGIGALAGLSAGMRAARRGAGLLGIAGAGLGAAGLATLPLSMIGSGVISRLGDVNRVHQETRGLIGGGADLDATGRGLNRSASQEMFKGFTGLATENTRVNRTDVMNLLAMGRQENLFQFTPQSAKDLGKAIKNITSMIHTFSEIVEAPDMQSAVQMMGKLQRQGFKIENQMHAAKQMRQYSRMAGMDVNELMSQEGQAGSMAFQQYGMMGGRGMLMAGQTAGSVNFLAQSGAINASTLARAGGTSGATQGITNAIARLMGNQIQGVMLPGFMKGSNISQERLQGFMSGKLGIQDMLNTSGAFGGPGGTKAMIDFTYSSGGKMDKMLEQLQKDPRKMNQFLRQNVEGMRNLAGRDNVDPRAVMTGMMGMSGPEAEILYQSLYNPAMDIQLKQQEKRTKIEDLAQRRAKAAYDRSPLTALKRMTRGVAADLEDTFIAPFTTKILKAGDYLEKEKFDSFQMVDTSTLGVSGVSDIGLLSKMGGIPAKGAATGSLANIDNFREAASRRSIWGTITGQTRIEEYSNMTRALVKEGVDKGPHGLSGAGLLVTKDVAKFYDRASDISGRISGIGTEGGIKGISGAVEQEVFEKIQSSMRGKSFNRITQMVGSGKNVTADILESLGGDKQRAMDIEALALKDLERTDQGSQDSIAQLERMSDEKASIILKVSAEESKAKVDALKDSELGRETYDALRGLEEGFGLKEDETREAGVLAYKTQLKKGSPEYKEFMEKAAAVAGVSVEDYEKTLAGTRGKLIDKVGIDKYKELTTEAGKKIQAGNTNFLTDDDEENVARTLGRAALVRTDERFMKAKSDFEGMFGEGLVTPEQIAAGGKGNEIKTIASTLIKGLDYKGKSVADIKKQLAAGGMSGTMQDDFANVINKFQGNTEELNKQVERVATEKLNASVSKEDAEAARQGEAGLVDLSDKAMKPLNDTVSILKLLYKNSEGWGAESDLSKAMGDTTTAVSE